MFKLTITVMDNVTESHYCETREAAETAGENAVCLYADDFHIEPMERA